MARSVVDRARQLAGIIVAVALAFTVSGPVASAAAPIYIEGENYRLSPDGSMSMEDVKLRHGSGERLTRISAGRAHRMDRPGGVVELTLSSNVHVEFRDAVLDAETATLVIRGEELVSVQVRGSQAQFSHQPKRLARRVRGRADVIEYSAASDQVKFSGRTFWTDGRYEINPEPRNSSVIYNMEDGSVLVPGRGTLSSSEQDAERVPPPRTPDRSTAQ